MSWYRTGTVNVTNNSDIVTGVGTDWLNAAREGDVFQGPDMVSYEIIQLINAGSLRCRPAYRGATAAGQSYALIPTRSRDVETATSIATLVNNYQGVRDNAGTGKFAAGSAGVPSLRGIGDEDTGINFPGGNALDLMSGGAASLRLQGGVASGDAVQNGRADSTTGKLLKVGAFGMGGQLDMRNTGVIDGTQAPSAFFGKGRMSGLADGGQLGVGVGGYGVLTIDAHWQDISARLAIRRRFDSSEYSWVSWAVDANTWTPWVQVNEPPVRGSNANGSYVRFASGLQYCIQTIAAPIDQSVGAVFRSLSKSWTFPAAFASGSLPQCSAHEISGAGRTWSGLGDTATDSSGSSFSFFSAVSVSASPVFAVGAWGYYK